MNRLIHRALKLRLGISVEEMTMRALTIGLSIALIGGGAFAQGPSYSPASPTPPRGAATAPAAPDTSSPGASTNDRNPAIATGTSNSSIPAKGKNSFTETQARKRLEARGYTNVADLKKDNNGIWRGHAQKEGTSSNVWLDYKGNVGQE
jgi:hypothetical protein